MSKNSSSGSVKETSSFRSLLRHEPKPTEAHGYLHIQGSFEPKSKKTGCEEHQNTESFWSPSSLVDAISSSLAVKKLRSVLQIKALDENAPFTKLRIVFESPEAAHEAYVTWRNKKNNTRHDHVQYGQNFPIFQSTVTNN